jgi:hypothetical protein
MSRSSPERILARSAKAWSDMEKWRSTLEDANELTAPNRNVRRAMGEGQERTGRAMDSTAILARKRGAARILGDFTPPFTRFVELVPGDLTPENQKEDLGKALAPVSILLQSTFLDGRYHNAGQEMAFDLTDGTGAMLALESDDNDRVVEFVAVHAATVALERGKFGGLDGRFRKLKRTPGMIAQEWRDAQIPKEILKAGKDAPDAEIELTEATTWDDDEKVWRYEVLCQVAGYSGPHRMVDRASRTCPWINPRWTVLPGEVQGRGPTLDALPDVRTLNKVVELTLQNAAMAMAGMYTALNDGVLNPDTFRIAPGAVHTVARNAGHLGPSLQPLETSRNFDVSELIASDLRMNIKKALLDNQLPPDSGRNPTAYEIMQRMRELALDASIAYGRLLSEWLVPLVQRILEILWKKQLLKDFVTVDQLLIKVKVTSPLARAQDLDDVDRAIRWLTILAQFAPNDMAIIAKIDDMLAWMASAIGVKPQFVASPEERKAAREQQQAVAAATALAQGGGKPDLSSVMGAIAA